MADTQGGRSDLAKLDKALREATTAHVTSRVRVIVRVEPGKRAAVKKSLVAQLFGARVSNCDGTEPGRATKFDVDSEYPAFTFT